MANPTILFENTFVDGTFAVVTGGETAGYEKENALDWRLHTESRWKANVTDAEIVFSMDYGSAIALDAFAFGGHNMGTLGANLLVEYSATDADWGTGNDAVASVAVADDYPVLKTWTAVSKRYWRVSFTGQPWASLAQIGAMTLGRRIDFEGGANEDMDPYGFGLKIEAARNNNGSPLGVNVVSRTKDFSISYGGDDPGFTTTGFWDASTGLNIDDHFTPHVESGKPFWFTWNPTTDPRVWLCQALEGWANPFIDTTARRGWTAKFRGYRETS